MDLWVQLKKELCARLGSRPAQRILIQEEVDAKISLLHRGIVNNCEPTDAWANADVSA